MVRHEPRVLSVASAVVLCGLSGFWPDALQVAAGEGFLRGDVDGSFRLEITDAIRIFQFLFLGQAGGVSCQDAADVDDNGTVQLTDGIYLLSYLFRQGGPPPAPFPECGDDPTEDAVGCETHDGCEFAITFYGQRFKGDGVFFVIDRSPPMSNVGELTITKREILQRLGELSDRARFGMVFFDAGVRKFPSSGLPADATQEMKDSAASFVQSVNGGIGTCVQKGFVAALGFLDASTAKENILIYVGDGGGTCMVADEASYLKETVDVVTKTNQGRARIHTIGVVNPGKVQEKFLKDLAAANGGTYTRITR